MDIERIDWWTEATEKIMEKPKFKRIQYFVGVDVFESEQSNISMGAFVVSKITDNKIEIISHRTFGKSKWYSLERFRFKVGLLYWKYCRNATIIIEKNGRTN